VFLKQTDGLIEIYYFKMTKNKIDKTNCSVFAVTRTCFHLFPRCGVKPKYVFIENVFGSKDRLERRKA
jgi:hypothetical protein